MKRFVTTGIVLTRIDYGEADRILTLLTPDYGKVHLVARGVRRIKSKLAGGIELFSISDIVYTPGRGELGTLVSTQLIRHYRHIVEDIERTMLGYELIKQLHKVTEDEPEPEYFALLEHTFVALDDHELDLGIIKLWFAMRLLQLNGYTPNLRTDKAGHALQMNSAYDFNFDDSVFFQSEHGHFHADHIKFLRLGFSSTTPKLLNQVQGGEALMQACSPLVTTMLTTLLRV
jgi:DNA repair protein RecO (recombination protein O)